jgi:hypothetical protein
MARRDGKPSCMPQPDIGSNENPPFSFRTVTAAADSHFRVIYGIEMTLKLRR